MFRHLSGLSVLAALALLQATPPARAETYQTCAGVIESLPATISSQGVWCLRKDLSTALASGNAIEITTNNVTIDCNGFKIGGLAAGTGTMAVGIHAEERLNIGIRNCSVRGFHDGIALEGATTTGGHLVEDNRLDQNTAIAIRVQGDGSVVRRNLVRDTGGSTVTGAVRGVSVEGEVDVLDNTISGVAVAVGSGGMATGLRSDWNQGGSIVGNRIRGLVSDGTSAWGMGFYMNSRVVVAGNHVRVFNDGDVAVLCLNGTANAILKDNVLVSTTNTGVATCIDGGGNFTVP